MKNSHFYFRDSENVGVLKDRVFKVDYKGDKLYWTGSSIVLTLTPIYEDEEDVPTYVIDMCIEESLSDENQFVPSVEVDGMGEGFGNTRFDRKFIDWLYDNGYVEGDNPHFTDKAKHLPNYWDI